MYDVTKQVRDLQSFGYVILPRPFGTSFIVKSPDGRAIHERDFEKEIDMILEKELEKVDKILEKELSNG
jgi:predicted subunit of tRNA(5-methylaminomethyl-2-thiouridylate) methyltransferase